MKRRGFSIIELIVVLAIIAIGFGVTVLKFSIVDKIGAKNEIKTFVDDYSYMRDFSLSSGRVSSISFNEDGYSLSGTSKIVRKLKYIKPSKKTIITFDGSGFVSPEMTIPGHNLVFVSRKDPEIEWYFTIQAVGGYLNEKNK